MRLASDAPDGRTQPSERTIPILARSLSTTLHPSVIEGASALLNCNTDRNVFELDKRYRQFQPAPVVNPQGFGLGVSKEGREFLAVHNGAAKRVLASTVTGDGTVSGWSGNLINGTGLGSGVWRVWQYGKWLFMANPTVGVRYKEIGTNELLKLYRNYDLNTNGDISTFKPPYDEITFGGGDSITSGAYHTGGNFSLVNDGIQMYDPWDPSGLRWTYHEFILTFGSSKDLSRSDYLAFNISTLQGNKLADSEMAFSIGNATHSTQATFLRARVRKGFLSSQNHAVVWIDLSGIDRSERTAVTKIHFGLYLERNGPDGFHIKPFRKGCTFLQSYEGSKIDNLKPSTAPDIEYAYSYIEAAGTNESGATLVVLPGAQSLGETFHQSLPYLGSSPKLTVSVNTDPPYNATSKVRFYRKVEGVWYRIDDNTILNTGTPSWTDTRTADEVAALTSANITIGGVDPPASGEVKGIDFGVQWKGSCVYFGNGKAYYSRVGLDGFKDVLWDDITMDNAPDNDLARPRTQLADPGTGQKIVAAVSNDALFLFTRHRGFVVIGDLPAEASFPRNLGGVRGVLGPHAACAWKTGAVYASDDGLWYVDAPYSVGAVEIQDPIELTKDIRPTWATLIGNTTVRQKAVVASHDDELWVFCEGRYLHLTRERKWVYGEWANGATVYSAASNAEIGLCMVMGDGTLGVIGPWKTDGGTNTAGSNGTAPTWTYTTPIVTEALHYIGVRALFEYVTAPNVSFLVKSERNPSGVTRSFTAARDWGYSPLPHNVDAPHNGGMWGRVTISGGANDVVYGAELMVTPAEEKYRWTS